MKQRGSIICVKGKSWVEVYKPEGDELVKQAEILHYQKKYDMYSERITF